MVIRRYKISLILLISVLFFLGGVKLYAERVTFTEAEHVALNWYNLFLPEKIKNFNNKEVIFSELSENKNFYIFTFSTGGFVIISADDRIQPVLAYSFDSEIVKTSLNPAIYVLLESYENTVKNLLNNKLISLERNPIWDEIKSNDFRRYRKKTFDFIAPLIKAKWGQGGGWNRFCPDDPAAYGGHAPVGCVAVALGQILSYWDYPRYGDGSNSYNNIKYGIIAANFESSEYIWSYMSDTISDDYNALLLYHSGVALKMKYDTYNSSANTYYRSIPALINHFKYNPDIDYKRKSEYS